MNRNILLLPFAVTVLTSIARTQSLGVELAVSGLSNPLALDAPDGDDRLFICEQNTARIRVVDAAGTLLPAPFLDVGALASSGGERGLLGLAFHPDYANNGLFYINYTNNAGDTVVAEYEATPPTSNTADAGSAKILLTIDQPASNHNGGCLRFGPDGFLYISMGDGGGSNDNAGAGNNAQTITNNLLGTLLRIDVNGDDFPGDAGRNYAIPPSNPLVGITGDDEIWAYGLRNPWRFSFDRLTGDLWIGDVGQNAREEVDFQPASSTGGENYGWRCREGNICTGLSGCTCADPTLVDPVGTYVNTGFGGDCSVTGGYLYRGNDVPSAQGLYFFGDFCSSKIWTLDPANNFAMVEITAALEPAGAPTISSITSFGEDGHGELYIIEQNSEIWRIVEVCNGSATSYCQTAANSVNPNGSLITTFGSLSISDNNFGLTATGAIPNGFGIFYYGTQQTQQAFGDGFRCVGGATVRLNPPVQMSFFGDGVRILDFSTLPASLIQGGDTVDFQFWYRDPTGPGSSGFNLSDGIEVTFCP